MKEYLFEMHAHTSQTSRCGEVPAEQVVNTFKNLGYDGIVITDHMHTGTSHGRRKRIISSRVTELQRHLRPRISRFFSAWS